MWDVGHARWKAPVERSMLVAVLAVLLVSCGSGRQVEVTSAASATPVRPPPAATSTFQGAIDTLDPDAGAMVVAVQIVWAPVMEAKAHERRVTVDTTTRWDPGASIRSLRTGDEVQVDAEEGLDGTWRAVRVRLFDID